MNERERILALVREGIISTEEAIELLEHAARKQGKDAMRKSTEEAAFTEEPVVEEVEETPEEPEMTEEEKQDRANLEKILEEISNEISFFSSRIDEKAEALSVLRRQIKLKEERRQEIATQEELDALTPDLEIEAVRLEEELDALHSQEASLLEEKRKMEEKMRSLRKEQLEQNVRSLGEKFGSREDWKEAATDISGKLNKVGAQITDFFSNTFQTVMENVDWKDVNVKVPGIVTTKFSHEFLYEGATATILDFQLANGNIILESWDKEDIKVAADIKIYAKFEEASPMEAFEARSNITIDEERLQFHVPNKRVRCDMTVYLPKREYDYAAFKLLNGSVLVKGIKGKDFYVKSTNGKLEFTDVEATMLEVDGVNGSVTVEGGKLVDLVAKLVNGAITTRGPIVSSTLSLVNGDIKMTYKDTDAKRIHASTVNGSVKLALPAGKSVEAEAASSLGEIKNRIENVEILKQRDEKTNKQLQFRRLDATEPVMVELKTTNGNILLKNADEKKDK